MIDDFNIDINIHIQKKRGRKSAAERESTEYKEKQNKERDIEKLAAIFIKSPSDYTFNNLCKRINWGLRSHIIKIVGTNEGVDDVLSKTFESIYYKHYQFDPNIAKFSTWMYKIALNFALKYIQDETHVNKGAQLSIDISDLYESTLCTETDTTSGISACDDEPHLNMYIDKENDPIVYTKDDAITNLYDVSVSCIKDLPEHLKIVMTERLLNNKKILDIAEDNNIPVSSVKNWLRKGKSVLQNTIKSKYSKLYCLYKDSVLTD
jgi:RNA polymerase sigma factor (sigma-70 family)